MTNDDTERLVAAARQAATRAHAPYSRFAVGCAVLGEDGTIVSGANVENACYRLGTCAEQSGLAAAQMAFGIAGVRAIAIAGGHMAGERATPITPCGGCRQLIAEAAAQAAWDVRVICAGLEGDERIDTTIATLLPGAFAL